MGGDKHVANFRKLIIFWDKDTGSDQATQMGALEIRPGVAAAADTKYAKRRYQIREEKYAQKIPALKECDWLKELDDLLRIMEASPAGREVVDTLRECRQIPGSGRNVGADYGVNDPKYGINPRKLNAYEATREGFPDLQRPVHINMVILQTECEPLCLTADTGGADSNGHGTFATVLFNARDCLLIDEEVLPPEVTLMHEMTHGVHMVCGESGSFHKTPIELSGQSRYHIATEWFMDKHKVPYASIEEWEEARDRNDPSWRELDPETREGVGEKIKYFRLLMRLASEISPAFPSCPPGRSRDDIFFQRPANQEEVVTHGNDVVLAWFHGVRHVLQVRGLDLLPGQARSDELATELLESILQQRVVTEITAEEAASNQVYRQIGRTVNEVRFCRECNYRPRKSYSPFLSIKEGETIKKMFRVVELTAPRRSLPDSTFQSDLPINSLYDALPSDGILGPYTRRAIRRYIEILQAWPPGGGAAGDEEDAWLPGDDSQYDCVANEPIPTVTVETSSVPADIIEEAKAIADDALDNPGTSVFQRSTKRLYRSGPAIPLPPLRQL
ncbi:hypothetical protein ACIQU6_44480 [Streptomyces sp. NPDC090442]|uniref:hypothetical protein n=1 Tax=Streptomyces sp. NPDC090442 TaxID=3365962 RepID=UPI00380B806E